MNSVSGWSAIVIHLETVQMSSSREWQSRCRNRKLIMIAKRAEQTAAKCQRAALFERLDICQNSIRLPRSTSQLCRQQHKRGDGCCGSGHRGSCGFAEAAGAAGCACRCIVTRSAPAARYASCAAHTGHLGWISGKFMSLNACSKQFTAGQLSDYRVYRSDVCLKRIQNQIK